MAFDLPWEIDGVATINGVKTSAGIYRSIPIDATPDETDEVCRVEYQYANFIVRAVNAHDALVEALGEAVLQIEYLHEKFGKETGSGNFVLACARRALARCSSQVEQPQ